MKFDPNKAFPYPVLRPYSDDYLHVDFQTTADLAVGSDKIKAHIEYAISAEAIVDQVKEANAEYVAVISCRDTYFRTVIKTAQSQVDSEFPPGSLRGEVQIDPYVVVTRPIMNYTSSDLNPEFGEGPLVFSPGDILAQDEPQVFFIDRDLFKPVTSVFELVKRDGLSDGEWLIDFEQDHVQIQLSAKMKEAIDDARNSTANRLILLNSIYFSAVSQSIQKLLQGEGEYDGCRWAAIIRQQASNSGLDLSAHDAYVSATRLMKYPLNALNAHVFQSGRE